MVCVWRLEGNFKLLVFFFYWDIFIVLVFVFFKLDSLKSFRDSFKNCFCLFFIYRVFGLLFIVLFIRVLGIEFKILDFFGKYFYSLRYLFIFVMLLKCNLI